MTADGDGSSTEGNDIPRGPRGGRKHLPGRGHRREHVKRSEQKASNKRKAYRKQRKKEEQERIRMYWDSLSPEKRNLLKGKKGVDPDARRSG